MGFARLATRFAEMALFGAALGLAGCANAQQPVQAGTTTAQRSAYLTIDQLRELYEDEQSRYLNVGDMKVHYKDEGEGPVLFMVHGSESSLKTWDVIAAKLKDRYRIVRYDIPGYGLSDGPSDSDVETIDPMDVPLALVKKLGIDKMTFVGVSSGGTMGMYLAAEHPALVDRLIISNTPSDPVDTSHLVMPEGLTAAIARAKETGFRDQDFWNEFLSYFAGDPDRISTQTRKEYYDFYRRTPEKHPIAMVAVIGDGIVAMERMSRVKQPTFQIWGGADHLLPESAAIASAGHLSSAQISRIVMPDVGHYPPLEVPERFARLIAAYVEAGVPNP